MRRTEKDAARSKAQGPDPSVADLKKVPEFGGIDCKLFRPVKERITTRLDADVLHWLRRKEQYQTYINDLLRATMIREQKGALSLKARNLQKP